MIDAEVRKGCGWMNCSSTTWAGKGRTGNLRLEAKAPVDVHGGDASTVLRGRIGYRQGWQLQGLSR